MFSRETGSRQRLPERHLHWRGTDRFEPDGPPGIVEVARTSCRHADARRPAPPDCLVPDVKRVKPGAAYGFRVRRRRRTSSPARTRPQPAARPLTAGSGTAAAVIGVFTWFSNANELTVTWLGLSTT